MSMRIRLVTTVLIALLAMVAFDLDTPLWTTLHAAGGDDYNTELNTPLVGDYTNFAGLSPVMLEGVGLVVGLAGTGGDPAPSMYRTSLLEDMRKRGVREPNTILQSPSTALVIVRAYLPPLMKIGETLDVEVIMPDSAEGTSLAGGWLMETNLHEQAFVPGRGLLKGHPYARAKGPVLIAGANKRTSANDPILKRGRVLGGGTVLKERELAIYLRNDFRSVRNSTRIADAIGRRFHHFDKHGIKKPLAEAKTDQKLVLDVHPRYKDNYPRYLQVIRSVAFRETPVSQRVRMQKLHDELLTAESAEVAALQLEAIGKDAVPILKAGLKSKSLEVRFHAAVALAYLEEPESIAVLTEAARTERAFRVFALAAMSTVDDAEAHIALRELMSEESAETRYGAFRALWTLDRNDPFIRGKSMGKSSEESDDPTSKPSKSGLWTFHVLQTKGPEMVHCTLRTRPEVVLFGADQKLTAPFILTAGRHVMINAQPGSDKVVLTRFEPNRPDQRREVSLRLFDVILAADELGATYPDIVQMLAEASHQRNLAARLETDALPESGRVYTRPETAKGPKKKAKVGREHLSPNLFPRFEEGEETVNSEEMEAEVKRQSATGGMANVAENKDGGDKDDDKKSLWKFWDREK